MSSDDDAEGYNASHRERAIIAGMNQQEISWRATPEHGEVVDRDGQAIGTVEAILGDSDDDIFHGLAVHVVETGRVVEVLAEKVQRITPDRVETTLTHSDLASLPAYHESRWYRVEWTGRHHQDPTWRPSDEA